MPGETVVPASATRIGWKTSLRLGAEPLDHAAQRRLDRVSTSNGSSLGERRRARRPARARPSSPQPLLARRRVVGRAVEDEARPAARSRPASGSSRCADRDRRRAGPSRPVNASRRARQLVERQLAQVAAVHPAQLLLVEARRVALRRARASKRSTSSLGREDRLVVGVAPAEQREVVAHRLGQVAGVAQLLDRRRAVALGELLAVGAVQQRQVGVDAAARRPSASRTSSCLGVLERWSSPRTTWVIAGVEVVDRDGEVVEHACRRRGRSPGRRGGRAGSVVSPRITSWTTVSPSSGTRRRTAPLALGARRGSRGRRRAAPCTP